MPARVLTQRGGGFFGLLFALGQYAYERAVADYSEDAGQGGGAAFV